MGGALGSQQRPSEPEKGEGASTLVLLGSAAGVGGRGHELVGLQAALPLRSLCLPALQPLSRQPPSKARATVAPLPMAAPAPKVLRTSMARKDTCELSLFSDEDDQA